ncbi:MAG: phenylalanine--tRNA ligase subunit beta [Deltaproteobacteria bacterium]
MKFTLNWLKQYVHVSISPEQLAERLTMAGLEVESLNYSGQGLDSVVIVRILGIKPHLSASKLVLCDVSDGARDYKIVCGAKNMNPGDLVALAKIGAILPPTEKFPDGVEIKSAKIRGEASEGMLCAENELGLSEESEGIMILPPSAPVGASLRDYLGLDDVGFEVGVTPNRADCLSVVGIAREAAAILGECVSYPGFDVSEDAGGSIGDFIKVRVEDGGGCPRYSCRVILDVKIAPSPEWLKARLEGSGIRAINNVVDITNFVLLELGQPLHAFDYDRIEGREIIVRSAEDCELVETLDGAKRNLSPRDVLICDGAKPVAIAGVMGAANTEISSTTTNILLESAYFDPSRVRGTSKRLGLRSESSYRFERGVDPNGVVKALNRAAELIRALAGGRVAGGAADVYPSAVLPPEVSVSLKRLRSVLGADISPERVAQIAAGLEFELIEAGGAEFKFRIPTFRFDIAREIDLIEEVARRYGYGNIPKALPSVRMTSSGANKRGADALARAKDTLLALGFSEAITLSFGNPKVFDLFDALPSVAVLNPISEEASAMRRSLVPGVVGVALANLNRQAQDARIFEAGRVYAPSSKGRLPVETLKIAGAAAGRAGAQLWERREADFFHIKGVVERLLEVFSLGDRIRFEKNTAVSFLHPGRSAAIVAGNAEVLGFAGELSADLQEKLGAAKKLYIFELDLDKISAYSKRAMRKFTPLPKFPAVKRDVALIAPDDLSAAEILREIKKSGAGLIEEAAVFDVFRGGSIEGGKKSVAVSLVLRAGDKTLTEEEINAAQNRILESLRLSLGAELRKI